VAQLVAHVVWDHEVAGSSPVYSTNLFLMKRNFFLHTKPFDLIIDIIIGITWVIVTIGLLSKSLDEISKPSDFAVQTGLIFLFACLVSAYFLGIFIIRKFFKKEDE
jgi:hypothetical protein